MFSIGTKPVSENFLENIDMYSVNDSIDFSGTTHIRK
jgi:hypothetical protein